MNDDGALVRSFGKNLHRYFRAMGVKPHICSFGGQTGETGQPLSSSKRLEILVKDFIGGRSVTGRLDLNIIRIFHRRTVLDSQILQCTGAQVSAMASPAGHTSYPSEVILIDGGDHLDHSARGALHRGVGGEPFPGGIAVRCMAIQAVQAQGRGNHSHRVHELVYGNSLEYLHVFETVFRHLGLWFLCTRPAGYRDAQTAHHYCSQHTKDCSPRSCFHLVSLPAWFVSGAVYVGNHSTRKLPVRTLS